MSINKTFHLKQIESFIYKIRNLWGFYRTVKEKDNPGAVCGFCIAKQDESFL